MISPKEKNFEENKGKSSGSDYGSTIALMLIGWLLLKAFLEWLFHGYLIFLYTLANLIQIIFQ